MSSTPSTDVISPSTTLVGWIVTGVMGRSMCSHLLNAGFTLTVFNRTLSKAQPILRRRLLHRRLPLRSPYRPPWPRLRRCPRRHDHLRALLRRRNIPRRASKSCSAVDAPVTGGDVGAKNGALASLAGGDERIVKKLNPLFALMGEVNYMVTPGKGQFAKPDHHMLFHNAWFSRRHDVRPQGWP